MRSLPNPRKWGLALLALPACASTSLTEPPPADGLADGVVALGRYGTAHLPASDREPFVLTDRRSGVRASITLEGASGRRAPGPTRGWDDSPRPGARHEVRALPEGFEDFVTFPSPGEEELRYRLSVEGVAGLRLVAGTLELLDATGAPRLRAAPPHVLDARGARRPARLDVLDCPYDTDPRAPWGRAPVALGSDACTVSVRWGAAAGDGAITYPVVVDPEWTSTGDMVFPRAKHAAAAVAGRVLVVGGSAVSPVPLAELFDPATETWAVVAQAGAERFDFTATTLAGDRVLLVGGTLADESAVLDGAEVYDHATGLFTDVGPMTTPRMWHTATALGDGRVLVIGGTDVPAPLQTNQPALSTAELFDPATGLFTPAGTESPRARHAAALLQDGRVLVIGGTQTIEVTADPAKSLATTALFEPVSTTWTAGPATSFARDSGRLVVLPSGRALAFGGWANGVGAPLATELFDPVAATWTPTSGPLDLHRLASAGVLLPNGGVLAIGGCCQLESVEIYSPITDAWVQTAELSTERGGPTATLLADGGVLVAGGFDDTYDPLASSEVFRLSPLGEPSDVAIACASGRLSGGVCCDTDCLDPCTSCLASEKGAGADGTCALVAEGSFDPKGTCEDALAISCGTTGRCGADGGCALYPAGTTCATQLCAFDAGSCDGTGVCVCPPPVCSADEQFFGGTDCAPYRCTAAGCPTQCASSDDCLEPYLCDKTGHCVLPEPTRGGLACSSGPGPQRPPWAAAIAVAHALLARRRSRRTVVRSLEDPS